MRIWIVVPTARPRCVRNIWDNFRRQHSSEDLRLCIVENGAALGACDRAQLKPHLLLSSETHQATAKNVAIAEILRRGGNDRICFWDDDDFYGRDFIAELTLHARRATVVGKRRHFTRLSNRDLYLFDEEGAEQASTWLHGPTCMARAHEIVDFPRETPNDDGLWCKHMREAGATFWATSVWNYLYDRSWPGPRVWEASDVMVRFQLGGVARNFGPVPDVFVSMANSREQRGAPVPEPGPVELADMLDSSAFPGLANGGTFDPQPCLAAAGPPERESYHG